MDLNKRFPGYWIQGNGNFAVVCSAGRRITLWPNLEIAQDAKHASCGRGCAYRDNPHLGYKLAPRESQPGQKISRSWKAMVDAA